MTTNCTTGLSFLLDVAKIDTTSELADPIAMRNRLISEAKSITQGVNSFTHMVSHLVQLSDEMDCTESLVRLIDYARAITDPFPLSYQARDKDDRGYHQSAYEDLGKAIEELGPCLIDFEFVSKVLGITCPSNTEEFRNFVKVRFHRADDYLEALIITLQILCGKYDATSIPPWIEREGTYNRFVLNFLT